MIATDCPSGKVVYPSVKWAERFAGMFNQIGSFRQRAYRCPECGGAHLTTSICRHRKQRQPWKVRRAAVVEGGL